MVLSQCTTCGACAAACPAVSCGPLAGEDTGAVQSLVREALSGAEPQPGAVIRALTCTGCRRCETVCPVGIKPWQAMEALKALLKECGQWTVGGDPSRPDSPQRVLAALLTTEEEHERITTAGEGEGTGVVFFPGCNVYEQPDKILTAMDLMDLAAPGWGFLPGLDACCGDACAFAGDPARAREQAGDLVDRLRSLGARTAVFWCTNCLCRLADYGGPPPFRAVTLASFLLENIHSLGLREQVPERAVLHEACKAARTGVDPGGPRGLLEAVPGLVLLEMERSGEDAACCGGGMGHGVGESMARSRLLEAAVRGADLLVDVCHYCHRVFAARCGSHGLKSANYVSVVARAAGVGREDLFLKYALWADAGRILSDALSRRASIPFNMDTLRRVVTETFASAYVGSAP